MDEQKRPSLMIATPMYGGQCTGNYVAGLLEATAKMQSVGVSVYWVQMSNESLITRARNELVRQFLMETTCDYLMFIDADIGFKGEDIAYLLAADRDIACGLYPKKEIDWVSIHKAAQQGEDRLEDFGGVFVMNLVDGEQEADEDGMIEVRHGGTGFMLIKRSVFQQLAPHVPTYRTATYKDENGDFARPIVHEFFATSIDHTGCLLSEDYHFCDLWRQHGGKVYANPFIKLDHVGTHIFNGNILRSGGNLK